MKPYYSSAEVTPLALTSAEVVFKPSTWKETMARHPKPMRDKVQAILEKQLIETVNRIYFLKSLNYD